MIYTKENIVGLKFICSWHKDKPISVYKIDSINVLMDEGCYSKIEGEFKDNIPIQDILDNFNNTINYHWIVINQKIPWYYKLLNAFQ